MHRRHECLRLCGGVRGENIAGGALSLRSFVLATSSPVEFPDVILGCILNQQVLRHATISHRAIGLVKLVEVICIANVLHLLSFHVKYAKERELHKKLSV